MIVEYKDLEFSGQKGYRRFVINRETRIGGKQIKIFWEAINKGEKVIVVNAPKYKGTTERKIVALGDSELRLYLRMPDFVDTLLERKADFIELAFHQGCKYRATIPPKQKGKN
jgi:hypothetical protein